MMVSRKCEIILWIVVLAAMAGLMGEVSAANRWYTARTIQGHTQPLSAGTETMTLPDGKTVGVRSASVSGGKIDLVISLYNNPMGDDDGNTQDVDLNSASQDAYEKIIQYFADGVYEATEGAHAIRNVRIYRGGLRQDADVIWQAAGHPGAWYMNQNNIAANINMYDRFSGHNFTNAADHEVGGYTLAHEFGHYFYGMLDEYCVWNNGWMALAENQKTRPCIMNDQWSAAGRNYTWLNFSTQYDTNSVAYRDYECRAGTAQFQAYGDGDWPVLSRNPDRDPLDTARQQWYRTHRGKRMYYPELAAVAPTGLAAPLITLSSATALGDLASRQDLNIIWMGTHTVVEIIIDSSGSMGPDADFTANKLVNAKAAAQLLVDQLPDQSAVGVIGFGDYPYTVSGITVVTSAAQRAVIKTAIDGIAAYGGTAIGDAALDALNQMQAFGHTNFTRVAFLLSDGQSNWGSDPLAAAASYQAAQIPMMTFGYGTISEIDPRLLTMAGMTGGSYYYAPVDLAQIAAAFQDAFAAVAARQNLAGGTYLASASALRGARDAVVDLPFQVDSTIADLDVTVGYALSNTVSLTLTAPNGALYQPSGTNQTASERLVSFSIEEPLDGLWHLAGTVSGGGSVRYQVSAGVNGFTYYLTASSMGGSTVTYPDPIRIVARLNRGPAIDEAVVKALITDSANRTTTLALENTDVGTYSAVFMPSNGLYSIRVQADNSANTALYTWTDILPSATDAGAIGDVTPDQPVNEGFTRTVSMQVTVTGADAAIVPLAPSSVTASDGTFADYVKISWQPVADAAVYEVWRSTEGSSATATRIGEVNRTFTNYMDSSVNVETHYDYWVKAVNVVGASALGSGDVGWPLFGPAIRVNNQSALSLWSGNAVTVSVLLRTGQYAGTPCDWWVAGIDETTGALYYLNSAFSWTPAAGFGDVRPVCMGGVFDIGLPYTVYSGTSLLPGTYRFYFGLDTIMNGVLDVNALVYDSAVLTIAP